MKYWNYLNHKKTAIGSAFLLAAVVIQKMTEIWTGDIPPEWIPKLVETLEWFEGLAAGVGLGHKGIKAVRSKESLSS